MRRVIVVLDGGVIQNIVVPPGVEVEVRDFDVEGGPTEGMMVDSFGFPYLQTIWQEGG